MSENVKQALAELVEQLPDDCTWDEVMDRIYVRQKIAESLADAEAGRVVDHDTVFADFEVDEL